MDVSVINEIKELLKMDVNKLKSNDQNKISKSTILENNEITELFSLVENGKPIPIKYYNKQLVELKKNTLPCVVCNKTGQYKCENNILCWTHAHNL